MSGTASMAAVEYVVRGDGSASVPGGLTEALRRRAELDDQVAARRAASADRLREALRPVATDAPGDPVGLLDLVVERADELAVRARDGDTACADALRAAVQVLVQTDLPDVDLRSPDRARFEDAAAGGVGAPPGVTASQLLDCVARHLPDATGVRELRQLTGGFSKETLTAVVDRAQGQDEIVVRKVVPGRTSDTLTGEFAALSFAWQGGVPVPEPLWLDETTLGAPAFATRRSAGRCLGDVWGPVEPVEPAAVVSAVRALARLHSLDTGALRATPLPPMTTHTEIVDAVAERRRVVDSVRTGVAEPYVALSAVLLAWLRAHAPGDVTHPVLVHGDFGLHNLLLDGTDLTAVLDWERAHLGHPAEDLAYLRPSVEEILPWPDLLDAYHRAGGPQTDADRFAYYTVWHDVWRGVSALRLRATFVSDPARVTDAMVGLLMTPRFLGRAAGNAF